MCFVKTVFNVVHCTLPFCVVTKDKMLKDMDEEEERKTFSSSENGSDGTDEDVENERRLQRALLEKDKVLN